METINVTKQTKENFELQRFQLRMKEKRNIFQDEFITIMLNKFKEDENDTGDKVY